MWTHVTNDMFDYSVNTSIINAAMDYESKLARNIAIVVSSIRLNSNLDENEFMSMSREDEDSRLGNKRLNCSLFEKQILSTLELIDYQDICKRLLTYSNCNIKKYDNVDVDEINRPMVGFKCAKCHFETIDLCQLRLHKREHMNAENLNIKV